MSRSKWEYCNFDWDEPTSVVVLTREGEEKSEVEGCGGFFRNKTDKAACTIARLGNRGWEAFQIHDGLMWFKREKRDQERGQKEEQ